MVVFSLAACSPAAEEKIATDPVVGNLPAKVSASGVVVPEKEALLSITADAFGLVQVSKKENSAVHLYNKHLGM